MKQKRGRPKKEVIRKVYCEVVEGAIWSDRCLYKLSQILDGNKICEGCIVRELERLSSLKIKGDYDSKDIKKPKNIKTPKDIKTLNDVKASTDTKQSYSIHNLVNLLGRSERTIQEYAQKGKIPAHKVGGRWAFNKEEIDCWLSKKECCSDVVVTTEGQGTEIATTIEETSPEEDGAPSDVNGNQKESF